MQEELEKECVLEDWQVKRTNKTLFIFIVIGIIIVFLAILAILNYFYFSEKEILSVNASGNETSINDSGNNLPVPNIAYINGTTPSTNVRAPNCTDKIKNADESGVDCGGKCKACSTGGGGGGGGSGKICTPDCSGKQCGDNGCGGSCGICNSSGYCDATGKCAIIPPNCINDDGCSSSGKFCDANTVYYCTLGSDGCFDRTNETICNSLEICISGACAEVHAVFVDNQLAADCNGNYSITNRDCHGSDGDAFKSLADASAVATVGDTVLIRSGTYNEAIVPANSGTAQNPITFRSYNNEGVRITGEYVDGTQWGDVDGWIFGFYIWEKSNIIIEGLNFEDITHGWARVVHSNNISIKNNYFFNAEADGMVGSIGFVNSSYNRILENTIRDGNDNLALVKSDYNLIKGNNISMGRHTLWTLKCSSYNIIRDNYFYNEIQKIGEVFDCEHAEDVDYFGLLAYNATKHNLIESNEFAYTAPGDGDGPFNHIQYAGQDGIIRNNLFYNSNGIGIGMTRYPDEAMYNKYNRVYNNVFYNNLGGGISTARISPDNYDNIYKNNIFYKNYPGLVGWADNYLSGSQITHGDMANFLFENNNIINSTPGQTDIIYDYYNHRITLAQAQATYPLLYRKNIESIPLFVNETSHNFNLQSSSPMIDSGAFLTVTLSAGSGTTMQVNDSRYFYDGYGISWEVGDVIQLDNAGKARVIRVDYSTNTLTLNQSLIWVNGQNVSLAYSGSKPDIGVYEYSSGIGGNSAQVEVHSLNIWSWIKGFLTGNTIKEITGYFLKTK